MVDEFVDSLQKNYDVKVNEWVGTQSTVLGLIGDTSVIDIDYIAAQDIVESVKRVQEPYKKANRKFHPDDTVVTLPGGQKIGDGGLPDRRPLLRGIGGPDCGDRQKREGLRRPVPSGRRFQAQNQPLCVPGAKGRGPGASAGSQESHRPAYRH